MSRAFWSVDDPLALLVDIMREIHISSLSSSTAASAGKEETGEAAGADDPPGFRTRDRRRDANADATDGGRSFGAATRALMARGHVILGAVAKGSKIERHSKGSGALGAEAARKVHT